MNPKTLQYIRGYSEIGVTLNTYTYIGFEDASAKMLAMECSFATATSETSGETRINTGFVEMRRLNLHLFYTEWWMLPDDIK